MSNNNFIREVLHVNPLKYSSCIVHYNGKIGEGTSWEYYGGGEKFKVEITPEQANFIARTITEKDQHPDRVLLESLPEPLISRTGEKIELTSFAQVAFYDFIR